MPKSGAVVALEKPDPTANRLSRLANSLDSLVLGPDLSELATERDSLVTSIRGYLLPRLTDSDHKLTVVFAGPTGSGKSTLVNSLARRPLSATGPLRPTTRGPIAFTADQTDGFDVGGVAVSCVSGSAPILQTMTLIDTPDIDSTAVGHRVMAERLIDHADVVVFVTSALRYADEAPWQVLRRAVSRGAEVINVLNRVSASTAGATVDFGAKLESEGLSGRLVTVAEHHIDADQERVPSLSISALSRRLAEAGVDREVLGRSVFDRVLANTLSRVARLADDLTEVREGLSSREADLDVSLAAQRSRMAWPEEVGVTFPKDGRRRSVRRWLKRTPNPVTGLNQELLVAAVHSDLLRWASKVSEDADQAVEDAMPMLRAAVVDWASHIAEVVVDHDEELWVMTTRRDLLERVEVVYRHVGSSLLELEASRIEIAGLTELRTALISTVDA